MSALPAVPVTSLSSHPAACGMRIAAITCVTDKKRRPKSANGNGGARFREDKDIWEWRETLPDGRRFSGYGKSQMVAKQRCMEKVKQADKGIDVKTTKQRLDQYLDWWLLNIIEPNRAKEADRTEGSDEVAANLLRHGRIQMTSCTVTDRS